ncbi:sugar ABC transporter permease [Lachnospiraceae bacterium 50-23]|jgi:multiple sugar transport system permease protein|nr:sugar ABC transporter permease [Dorea sp.]GFI37515.1 putative multiple-sugar transport system permease YteP [Lachnospiraceae bacterium]
MGQNNLIVKRQRRFIFWMLLPAILFPLFFTYYPMAKGFVMAFQNYNILNINHIQWCGLDNFKALFSRSPGNMFFITIGNTVKWVGISLFFQFTIGFGLALLLKKKFKGSGAYQGCIFFPWAVSGFLIGIIWRWLYNGTSGVFNDIFIRLGILDKPFGFLANSNTALYACIVANIWYGIPYFTIMITAALRGVPADLYEAANMDGASPLQQFIRITVPSIKSTLLLTLLLRTIWIFNFPDLIYAMTNGGPSGSSNIITSYMLQLVNNLDYGAASAVGVLCVLTELIFVVLYLKVTKYGKEE